MTPVARKILLTAGALFAVGLLVALMLGLADQDSAANALWFTAVLLSILLALAGLVAWLAETLTRKGASQR